MPKEKSWIKFVLAGAGIPIAVAIYLFNRPEPQIESISSTVATSIGISVASYSTLSRIDKQAELQHQISELDWAKLMVIYREGNSEGKAWVLMVLFFLHGNNPHSKESLAMAQDYVSKNKPDYWLGAILLMKMWGDPSWKTYNNELLQNKDSNVRAGAISDQKLIMGPGSTTAIPPQRKL